MQNLELFPAFVRRALSTIYARFNIFIRLECDDGERLTGGTGAE